MLNHIWAFLVVCGILVGFGSALNKVRVGQDTIVKMVDGKEVREVVHYATWKQKVRSLSDAGNRLAKEMFNQVGFNWTDAAGKTRDGAVGIAVSYIGLIALWLGIMKVAEASGLILLLSRMIAPLFRFIFPSIPRDHPASGAILMNFSANMLGLDNAATPLGIKAMQELQTLNGRKDTASNAMVMFLALNVSSLTLIPASVIALRGSKESTAPASFMPVMLVATACGTLTAFILCKIIERKSKDTPRADSPEAATEPGSISTEVAL
ncbi:MAG: nucleoside recognition domain-containing protein [Candidatus Sumerlaeaceae bacterium]